MFKVTLIGSRKSTINEDRTFIFLGYRIIKKGGKVISGGAIGEESLSPDSAGEKGARIAMRELGITGRTEIILPWPGFPKEDPKYPDGVDYFILDDFMDKFAETKLQGIGTIHHNLIGRGMPKLFRRNVFQITTMDYSMTDCVIYASETNKKGEPKGGTAVAIKLARAFGIPNFNIRIPEELIALKEFLKERDYV